MDEGNCPGWTFGSGTWNSYSASGPYAGGEHYSSTLNSTASFTFSGTGFSLYYSGDINRSNVQVWVDGNLLGTLNEYSGSLSYQQIYIGPVLSSGTHTVQFKNVGGSGAYMTIDAINILNLYDDTDPGWSFAARSLLTYTASGPIGDGKQYSSTANSTASFSINGTGFVFYYSGDTNLANVQVSIDGSVIGSFNEFNASHQYRLSYTSPVLAAASHTVQFKNLGGSGPFMTVDAVSILGGTAVADTTPPSAISDLAAST